MDSLEPKDYFEDLKTKFDKVDSEKLSHQLDSINEFMVRAKKVGQTNFLHKLVFTRENIAKEQVLLTEGFDTFIIKDDISKFIDKVQPKNSVKIIELSRFPRAIPIQCLDRIEKAKELGVFDDFCVVFTDLTEEKHETPAEKKFVERNRDPIVFGYFKHDKSGLKHERFYFITDWEDEFCDLTFTRMIDKMASMGMKNIDHKISYDENYLTQISKDALEEMSAKRSGSFDDDSFIKVVERKIEPKSFWQKVKDFFP